MSSSSLPDAWRVAAGAEVLDVRGLFERYHPSIWRLLRRLGVPLAQLDDAAQEVFWVAARKLEQIEPGKQHAFLYGVALRIAASELRRRASAPPRAELEELERLADGSPTPEEQLEESRARALLDLVLDRLPLELRTVLVLFELEGLDVRSIAEIEGIPVGTVGSRLRRAREEFSAIAKRVRAALDVPRRTG
ncbi:MAG: sigma-70 family RNA polymerase sigma factor [Deltaproteobacteria bacterium]